MKKCLAIAIFFMVLLMPLDVLAAYDYVVSSYHINMIVNEDNTFNITENIEAYFNVPKHGIIIELPLKNEIVRLDGTKTSNRAKISDVEVNEKYTVHKENNNMVIKIGDPDKMLTGVNHYSVSYKYNIGEDTGKSFDELYFNLIGGWDTTISDISFTITMPKDFDKSNLGFSAGAKSSAESRNVSYTVNGNVITGRYNTTLNPDESLNVRLELPDGYFVNASNNFDFMMLAALILPIFFLFLYLFVWIKYGKGDEIIETVEFYPPKGLNSAEIGFLYKGRVKNKDIISLLVYLANKGYVQIAETHEKLLFFKRKGFKITQGKAYKGNNVNEKIFLKGLFKETCAVTKKDLQNSFYVTLDEIKEHINSEENKEKIFEEVSWGKIILGIAMIFITFLLITVRPLLENASLDIFIIPGIGIPVLVFIAKVEFSKLLVILIGAYWSIEWLRMLLQVVSVDPIYLVTFIVGFACISGMGILIINFMRKRTTYGNEMLGKIRGFKNFLKTAEKAKLEELVEDDPEYFYNILPYTYVLGVSDKWIKKFEPIALQEPDWYSGTNTFTTAGFSSFMTSTMSSASNAMTSSPSSSSSGSSGGSSGGGFAGGGSGGSRGSSW